MEEGKGDSTPLNPLKMALAINRDTQLNPGERVALVGAVGHADNTSRKVCFSQKALADELNVSRDTVKRAFNKAMTLGYFTHKHPWRNERGHMMTDYFFASHPPVVHEKAWPVVHEKAWPVVHEKSRPVVQPVVHEKAPSTTSTTSNSANWIAANAPTFWDDHEAPGDGTASEQSPEKKPCGCNVAQVCSDCRPVPKVESKQPIWKQIQRHEAENEAEGLNALGYEDGESEIAPSRYQGRNRG